ncbi:copper resistance protein CopC [Arthrobacter sp. NPDC058288]|uniref:copper resistance CopC family protein n=1 Tax=Arthrobacter sp. NPDC058288 TaxID=3346424 RepID=UPI0036EB5F58
MPTHSKFTTRLWLAAAAMLMIPAVTASPATAHDALSSTEPAQDAIVASAPETVSLTLSEPPTDSKNLILSTIAVTDGAGKTVSDGKVTVYGPTLSTTVSAGTAGTYRVLWRAVSSDGHPIEGAYSFTVRTPAGGAVSPLPAPTPAPQTTDTGTVPDQERFRPPNDENAPLTVGIAAVLLAAGVGATLLVRRRNRKGRA